MAEHVAPSPTYARALRIVAAAIAAVALAKHLAGDFPDAAAERDLLIVRGGAAAIAVAIALLASGRPAVVRLQRLAFALGLDVALLCLGAVLVVPSQLWEQAVSLVAMMFGAAVFLPWPWRWQAALVGATLVAATVTVLLLIPGGALAGHVGARALVTLSGMAVLSVVGARLADHARQQLAAAEVDRRAQERRQMQEQRLDSMARLSGALAHQYNNILGGILTHAAVLHDEVTSPDARNAADEVLKGARRGRELTKELLGISRPETVTVRPASAAALVESAAALARAALPAGVDVQTDVPADIPPIAADVDQVVHVCLELVFNSRDAMRGRPNPRLTFTVSQETIGQGNERWPGAPPGRYVRIAISDNGRGMDPAIADRVFDPFFSTKPMHEAKGLGLAEVQRVMREHRGAVRIETAIGKGTTVHLLLPLAPGAAPASPVPPLPVGERGSGGEGGAKGATILVVDDEAIVRNSLKRALTRFGYRVLEAGDGGSALATMQAADPPVDLIILDLVLPGGGAGIFELLKAVRPDVRVLISSGYSPDADAARGLAERVEGFLPKPYELGQLRTAVTQALAGRAA